MQVLCSPCRSDDLRSFGVCYLSVPLFASTGTLRISYEAVMRRLELRKRYFIQRWKKGHLWPGHRGNAERPKRVRSLPPTPIGPLSASSSEQLLCVHNEAYEEASEERRTHRRDAEWLHQQNNPALLLLLSSSSSFVVRNQSCNSISVGCTVMIISMITIYNFMSGSSSSWCSCSSDYYRGSSAAADVRDAWNQLPGTAWAINSLCSSSGYI